MCPSTSLFEVFVGGRQPARSGYLLRNNGTSVHIVGTCSAVVGTNVTVVIHCRETITPYPTCAKSALKNCCAIMGNRGHCSNNF
jgi:hypothetical protein